MNFAPAHTGTAGLRVSACLLLLMVWHVPASEPSAVTGVEFLSSPDGRIKVSIRMPGSGTTDSPHWSANFRGKPILNDCRLSLHLAGAGDLLAGARILDAQRQSLDEVIPVLFGKSDHANNRYNEIRFALENAQRRRLEVIFRCFNDGVAFRYNLPQTGNLRTVTITNEGTSFGLVGEPVAFVQYLENFRTSHEHVVNSVPYREIRRDTLLDLPITFSWKDGTYAAITEAALRHYAGMSLMRLKEEKSIGDLVCRLTPRPDGTKVVRPLPARTPWRVVLIGDRPGALLESQTLYCLNDPCAVQDVSWIRPGKITFPWWNGDVYDGKREKPILSFEMASKYIDFCASEGIPIHSMTSTEISVTPWYHQSKPGVEPGPDTDVTRPREGFDLPAIRRYADSKHVRLWTWVHQGALRGKVDEAFAAFEELGWSGMMVDFFDHDDQESVEFAESILQAAARHHILIHFHGVWKPTGWQRTYPNLMNHEGALNLEYLKWSDLCTPKHNLSIGFTRLIAGPMDYHLGGFRSVPRAQFKPLNVAPNVLGTRCHMLALYVCFDNPAPMVADYPAAYESQPGFEFLKLVPTWWDETRVLVGEVGELLVTARRRGDDWYLGGISAGQPRELALTLNFLGARNYQTRLWQDAPETRTDPNKLTTGSFKVTSKDTLKVHLGPDGGVVAHLVPVSE